MRKNTKLLSGRETPSTPLAFSITLFPLPTILVPVQRRKSIGFNIRTSDSAKGPPDVFVSIGGKISERDSHGPIRCLESASVEENNRVVLRNRVPRAAPVARIVALAARALAHLKHRQSQIEKIFGTPSI